jgi:hypothetical protein
MLYGPSLKTYQWQVWSEEKWWQATNRVNDWLEPGPRPNGSNSKNGSNSRQNDTHHPPTDLPTYLHDHLPAHLPTYQPTYVPTCLYLQPHRALRGVIPASLCLVLGAILWKMVVTS